jgi:hypothetical protein
VLGVALSSALVGAGASEPASRTPASRERLDSVWRGVQQAQERHVSGCGALTETRVSPLLVRPLVLKGTFCAAGLDRFRVDYGGPEPVRVVYNAGVLNVSTDRGRRTEALDVGGAVRRAQGYFAGPRAPQNLERDFSITVAETGDRYTLQLLPSSGRIARRGRKSALPSSTATRFTRRIEIEGTSGVDSTFDIRIEKLDTPVDEETFSVYRP